MFMGESHFVCSTSIDLKLSGLPHLHKAAWSCRTLAGKEPLSDTGLLWGAYDKLLLIFCRDLVEDNPTLVQTSETQGFPSYYLHLSNIIAEARMVQLQSLLKRRFGIEGKSSILILETWNWRKAVPFTQHSFTSVS